MSDKSGVVNVYDSEKWEGTSFDDGSELESDSCSRGDLDFTYPCDACGGQGWEVMSFDDGSESDSVCWSCDGDGYLPLVTSQP